MEGPDGIPDQTGPSNHQIYQLAATDGK